MAVMKSHGKLSHAVCTYMYRENVRPLLQALSTRTELPKNMSEFTYVLVCDPNPKTLYDVGVQ